MSIEKKLNLIDREKMFEIYEKWPKISRESYFSGIEPIEKLSINNIVFAGMGGSGTLGDIFASILSKTNIHVSVIKGYNLPKTVDENTLVIITSISGNTHETISLLISAMKTKSRLICFSSNGKMEEICQQYQIQHRKIPMEHSPRASFTRFFYSMLQVLKPILPISENDIIESLVGLEKTKKKISYKNEKQNNTALQLAIWIKNVPLIYYPFGLNSVATRFKNSLQENSKIHAISEDIIESCHNSIMAWENKSDIQPILLRGKNDHEKTIERWDILKNYFNERKIDFFEVNSMSGNIITKIINLIYTLDYSSIYLAINNNINPSKIDSINYFKKELNFKL